MRELRERKPPSKAEEITCQGNNPESSEHSSDDFDEVNESQVDQPLNDFAKRFRPKNKTNAEAERVKLGGVFQERSPQHKIKKLDFYVERQNDVDESEQELEGEQMQSDQFSEHEQVAGDDVRSIVTDPEQVEEFLVFEQDKHGRTIVPCLTGDGETIKYTLKALCSCEVVKQKLIQLGLIANEANQQKDRKKHRHSPERKRDKKVKEKKKKKHHKSKRAHDENDLRMKQKEDQLRKYERQAIGKQLDKVNDLRILSKQLMAEVHIQEDNERNMNELRPDKVQAEVFTEDGTLDKHIPLEIVDFVNQPPFKGDTSGLQVVVRWKYYDKQNYQPNDSKVFYHQLRNDYKRLLIDLFVKKTELEREAKL